jgi:branched-chain amino acid transport system permease protein
MSTHAEHPGLVVQRWTTASIVSSLVIAGLVAALALVPEALSDSAVDRLTTLYVYVILAAMWNALAGYAGLVSVGQQAFFGLGGYFAIKLSTNGVGGYPSLILAGLIAGAIAIPISPFMLRLRGGEFAIGMWVVAEVCHLYVNGDRSLIAGATGTSFTGLNGYSTSDRRDYNYWLTLTIALVLLAVLFWLLRSRLGASLQAIRDDEDAARSVGVRALWAKGVVFVLAAVGCGAAGALWLASFPTFNPSSNFGVQWTAYMIFMALVGGLGTFEGPIIGAIVFFVIQDQWGDQGVWYLVGLGGAAMLFALLVPRGIWGTVEERFGIRLLPVGYWLRGVTPRGRAGTEPA